MAQYENIPGVNINVLDGQMLLGQNNTTNSLLIIADVNAPSRINVPEEPVLVRNENALRENFGGFFHRGLVNPIAAEWVNAWRQGLRNIYLLALQGNNDKEKFINLQKTLFTTMADLQVEHVVLASMYADKDIEGLTAADFDAAGLDELDGVQGYYVRRGTEAATALPETDTLTLMYKDIELNMTVEVGDNAMAPAVLVQELNKKVNSVLSEERLQDEVDIYFQLENNVAVMKADVELTIDTADGGTGILAALDLDTAAPAEMEGHGNPAALLGAYAERQNREVGETLCYISVAPPQSTSLAHIREWVNALVARRNEIHPAVQVLAVPGVGITVPGNLRTQWVSGATQYALLVQGLPPQIAPTNQVVPQAQALRVNLSMSQINVLSKHKYVTFRIKNNAITVVDGVTTAKDIYSGEDVTLSDFTRLSTLRAVNYIKRRMRVALDAYIGQPNEFAMYNSMRSTIKSEIKDAIENLIIQDASFSIELGDSFDQAIVKLTILPQFELRHIEVTIGLTTPDNFEG